MGNWKILDMIHTVSTGEVVTVYSAYEVEDEVTAVRKVFENEFSADPSDPGYIPYEDLTEAIVIGWVKDALGATVVSGISAVMMGKNNLASGNYSIAIGLEQCNS